MDKTIGIGLIVGLVVAVLSFVHTNDSFNQSQRTIITICVIFPPAMLALTLIIYFYNESSARRTESTEGKIVTKEKGDKQGEGLEKETLGSNTDIVKSGKTENQKDDSKRVTGLTVNDIFKAKKAQNKKRYTEAELREKIDRFEKSYKMGSISKETFEQKTNELYIELGRLQEKKIIEAQEEEELRIKEELLKENKDKIEDLRQLLFSGDITQEEFQKEKDGILSRALEEYKKKNNI